MIVDAGEVWWFELPRVGRKPGVVCSRRAVKLRLMPGVARITTVDRERALPTAMYPPFRLLAAPSEAARRPGVVPGRSIGGGGFMEAVALVGLLVVLLLVLVDRLIRQ